MERRAISRGGVKSAAYDRHARILEIEFDTGRVKQLRGVGEEIAREFLASSAPMSFYRDRLEEEFPARELSAEKAAASGEKKIDAAEAARLLFGG